MATQRDQLITVAALVLGISGAVLGVLSLVAILWLPSGEVPEAGMSPPAGAPGAGSLAQVSSAVGALEDGGDALSAQRVVPAGGDTDLEPPVHGRVSAGPEGQATPAAVSDTVRDRLAAVAETRPTSPAASRPSPLPAEPAQAGDGAVADRGPGSEEPQVQEPPQVASAGAPGRVAQVPSATPPAAEPEGMKTAASRAPDVGPTESREALESRASVPKAAGAAVGGARPSRADGSAETGVPLQGAGWILAQDPSRYTVQIMAVRDLADLRRFARKGQVDLKLAYYRISRKGQPWFILVGGAFEGREGAARAVRRLPASLRKNAPWIRSLESVQKEIRAAQG